MEAHSLTVMYGGRNLLQLLPGGLVLLPTNESERMDVIHALRSALTLVDPSGSEIPALPWDPIDRHILHETDEVSPSIQLMPVRAKENGGAAHTLSPEKDRFVPFGAAIDNVVFYHHDAKSDALLANAGELNHTHSSVLHIVP